MKISLQINKSIDENAAIYFEKSKKAKKKKEGLLEAIKETRRKLEKAESERPVEKAPELKRIQKRQWYEKFRWFLSSEGFLVIGGRDATTNELVIKKHTDKDDVVFHTDMSGSPFFVIKTEGKSPGSATMQEACNATFTFSRGAKTQLTAATFHVKPEQVSKEANPGEYLTKGAFMIRGKTTYLRPTFDLAIGMTNDGQIMSGPLEAVKKHCPTFVILEKSDKEKASDIAKKVQKLLGGELDDIIRAFPPAAVKMKK